MSKASVVRSNKLDHKDEDLDRQAPAAFGERLRERAAEIGLGMAEIGRLSGIKKQSMSGYWNGDRLCGSDKLFSLSDVLGVNARWLVSGKGQKSGGDLIAVEDADWEPVPLFDLRNVTDTGKGEPLSWTPFRKDWLRNNLGTASDLYLVKLISGYRGRIEDNHLYEGDLVFVREITMGELADGNIVIWRRDGALKVARFAVQQRDRDLGDIIYPGEVSEDQFVPVCRIYAKFLQRVG
ncbi:helix-turn-helix domain-containing protein [Sphingobium rhizovicinum]|uniref:Helix-turn-helix domain-containing protein n=1 Tax=Sphingobium rhizovicinum TaxID=432308 RepID=A0ABV7NK93_9SPHN